MDVQHHRIQEYLIGRGSGVISYRHRVHTCGLIATKRAAMQADDMHPVSARTQWAGGSSVDRTIANEPLRVRSEGERLDGVLHRPGPGRWPCVITAHGLLSTKASDKYLLLATHLAKAGFACLRFDFRGCGQSGGELKDTTVAGRIADLRAILAELQKHEALDGRFFIVGSSLGGYVTVFVAPEMPGVMATALWATPAHLRDLAARREALMGQGIGAPFFEELEVGTFAEAPRGLSHCLIIHGQQDELVPSSHARALYERANEPKALEILPGADHRLTNPADRELAIHLTTAWFTRHL